MFKLPKGIKLGNERGVILAVVGLSLLAFVSFFSLVVDLGYIFVTKNELQNVADSAALAAVIELPNGTEAARAKAVSFGEAHRVAGSPITVEPDHIVFGHYDIQNRTFNTNGSPINALEVEARRTDTASSGPLALFFAGVFGKDTSNVRAISRTVLDPRVVGVRGKNRLLPYSVINFVVDQDGDGAYDVGDIINIHPRNDAPGNFGFLDLDGGSNDVTELRYYIENGYDGDFIIPPGGSVQVSGSTGIEGNSLLNSFEAIVGDEVFLPVHNWVIGEGDGAIFNVISLLAVKVKSVKLTGDPGSRYIRVEIINFASSVLVVDPEAPDNTSVAKPRLAF